MSEPVLFDGLTIPQIVEKKIGKALPEAERVDIRDAKSLADAIAFLHLIDSVFKEVNAEWKRLLDDLTEAGMVLRDKIERYQRFMESPLGPKKKKPASAADPLGRAPEKKPEVKTNLFDDL
jgi:hypothetical protein